MTLYWMYSQKDDYFELLGGEDEAVWMSKYSDYIVFMTEVIL